MNKATAHLARSMIGISLIPMLLLCLILFNSQWVWAGGVVDPAAILTPEPLPLQPPGVSFNDPVFDVTLNRVSDANASGGYETHIYNQLQAFSSDNAYLLITGSEGYVVRRMSDFSQVAGLDASGWNAPRWHPGQPHVIVHFDSNADTVLRLQFTGVDTLTTTDVYIFPSRYQYIRGSQSFDEISDEGRWLAGLATCDDRVAVVFSLDIQNGVLGAELPIPDFYAGDCQPDPTWGEVEPDWIGVSKLGAYLVVQWKRDGEARCSGLESFDIRTGDFIGRVTDHHNHGDLGVDSDGVTEFFMTHETSSPQDNNRPAISMRLLPGGATSSPPVYLQAIDWADEDHISCQGPNGVCLVSWGSLGESYDTPFENELFLQYTDGAVMRLAHHRSSKCGYWVQPRASISRDGRYVVFASDWAEETGAESCTTWQDDMGRGDPYIIDLSTGETAPLADIKANGSDGPISIGPDETLSITVGLDPAASAGQAADWWVVADTPSGQLNGWNPFTRTFAPGLALTYQGPLVAFSDVALGGMTPMAQGVYTFFFAVDVNPNGVVDSDQVYYDMVSVTLTD